MKIIPENHFSKGEENVFSDFEKAMNVYKRSKYGSKEELEALKIIIDLMVKGKK